MALIIAGRTILSMDNNLRSPQTLNPTTSGKCVLGDIGGLCVSWQLTRPWRKTRLRCYSSNTWAHSAGNAHSFAKTLLGWNSPWLPITSHGFPQWSGPKEPPETRWNQVQEQTWEENQPGLFTLRLAVDSDRRHSKFQNKVESKDRNTI